MQIKNSTNHFGIIAILIHWAMAILLVGLVVFGLYMADLPISEEKLKLYGWHKEFGILALMFVIVRITWRLSNMNPSLAALPWWERLAARVVHWSFYVFMFTIPISGWLLTSASGLPVSFFGLFVLPNFVSPNEESRLLFTVIHQWLAYGLIATFCGHVAAALKHHFINKDDIMRRML